MRIIDWSSDCSSDLTIHRNVWLLPIPVGSAPAALEPTYVQRFASSASSTLRTCAAHNGAARAALALLPWPAMMPSTRRRVGVNWGALRRSEERRGGKEGVSMG